MATPNDLSFEDRLAAIPRVDALGARAVGRFRFGDWTPRHTRVAFLATPLAYLILGYSAGSHLPGNPLVLASLVLASVIGGVLVATYLPAPGARISVSSCVTSALAAPLLGLFLFQDALEVPAAGVVAAVVMALGLGQRFFGTAGCGARG